MNAKINLDILLENINGVAYKCLNDKYWTMLFMTSGIERITGYKPEDFIQNKTRSYVSIYHPEDIEKTWLAVQKAIKNHEPYTIEYRVIHKEGHILYLWEQGVGIYEENKLIALEGYICDITLQKLTEKELIKKVEEQTKKLLRQKEKEVKRQNFYRVLELTKGMSHELKNPLTLTLNSYQLLENEIKQVNQDKQRIMTLMNIMKNANMRINEIVETIDLTFRAVSNKKGKYPLTKLIRDSIQNHIKEEIENANIEVEIDESINHYELNVVEQNFVQSIRNIIKNSITAIKQSKENKRGKIRFSVEISEKGHKLKLKIHDNGIGIPKEIIENITLPFFSTASQSSKGGLGLATSKFLLQNCGIELVFETEEKKGTEVTLVIPSKRWRKNETN